MVAYFMRYYTRTKISHACRFHEILHTSLNISWLHISWDITLYPQYLVVAYFTRTKISRCCRFQEISHKNQNISWLQISGDITLYPQYLVVADFMRYYIRCNYFVFLSFCLFVFYQVWESVVEMIPQVNRPRTVAWGWLPVFDIKVVETSWGCLSAEKRFL